MAECDEAHPRRQFHLAERPLDRPAGDSELPLLRPMVPHRGRRERAAKMGIIDRRKRYEIEDMMRGDCPFAATGVTDGAMLRGVRFGKEIIKTQTVAMRSVTGTVRRITAEHRQLNKFHLD